MIVFNDLRVSPDGNRLYIDAMVAPYSFYENVHISEIYIDTDKTFITDGPSSKALKFTFDGTNKEESLILEAGTYDLPDTLNNNIFYIYAVADGYPVGDPGCTWDNATTLGVTLNWHPIYQKGLSYIRETIKECCGINRWFKDYILRLKAFELALRTSQYVLANELFNKWFIGRKVSPKGSCRCTRKY